MKKLTLLIVSIIVIAMSMTSCKKETEQVSPSYQEVYTNTLPDYYFDKTTPHVKQIKFYTESDYFKKESNIDLYLTTSPNVYNSVMKTEGLFLSKTDSSYTYKVLIKGETDNMVFIYRDNKLHHINFKSSEFKK